MPADEHKMEFTKGTKVWAKDKKGFWGQASVIGYEAATEAPGGSSGSSPVKARARITFKGFSAKFDEWINVGAGCAPRAHGSEFHLFFLFAILSSLTLSCVCVCAAATLDAVKFGPWPRDGKAKAVTRTGITSSPRSSTCR